MVVGGGYGCGHNMQFSLTAIVEGFHIQSLHIILPHDSCSGEYALHNS